VVAVAAAEVEAEDSVQPGQHFWPRRGGGGDAWGGATIDDMLGFAGGGDPPVGVPSLVGERGPELFVPKVPGTIFLTIAWRRTGHELRFARGRDDAGLLEQMQVIAANTAGQAVGAAAAQAARQSRQMFGHR